MTQDISYEQALTAFAHKNFRPLYFVFGEEKFLMTELQNTLLEHALAVHERDFNLDILYGSDVDGAQALSYCQGYPMMAERRVVIIRDFEKMANNSVFAPYAKNPNPDTVVMLLCGSKPNLTNNPYRALKSSSVVIELKAIKENQVGGWVQKQVSKTGKKIRPDAVQMLVDFNGNNLHTLANEVDKLQAYVGHKTEITRDDVLDVGGHAREFNVFELQKAVGQADFLAALHIVEHMLQQKTNRAGEALMMVSILSAYFQKLWKLVGCQNLNMSDKQMAERVGISPYFIKEYVMSLRKYPYSSILRALNALLAADYELKGGSSRNPELILHLLLLKIIPHPTTRAIGYQTTSKGITI
ncbi:MAG TPA: DNA polymerase III subunit delta [Rhodothermales bacterium]|nr:DNA polymerase III subunit delta [Rhodothermales bacterium]